MAVIRTDFRNHVKQYCRSCGRTISYQQYKRHGMCGSCTQHKGIPPGLYMLIEMVDRRPSTMDGCPLYANEVRLMLKDDRLRIGQVLERWTPGMGDVEYGIFYAVVSMNGAGLGIEEMG